jgi:S1-C subfamily serine protease
LAEDLDLPGAWEGVIIIKVVRGSVAYRLRFQPGDIIVAVNRKEVAEVIALAEALERARTQWRISFSRKGKVRHVEFTL